MYPTYRIIINMVILYKDGHSRIIFPQKPQLSGGVWNQIDIRAFDEVSIVDEATYRVFGQNVTTYLLLIS
jgi:hypothetical protein